MADQPHDRIRIPPKLDRYRWPMRDPGSATEILGRDAELHAVATWADRATNTRADLVISGPPGIGKSSLWEIAIARGAGAWCNRPAEPAG
jgi:hypothetical protein